MGQDVIWKSIKGRLGIASVVFVDILRKLSVLIAHAVRIFIRGVVLKMTKFVCLTCWKSKDDSEIRWYKNEQCCERCFVRYQNLA